MPLVLTCRGFPGERHVRSLGLFTHKFLPDFVGLRFADGHCLVGAAPPHNVSVQSMWQAYCQVKERQW